ESGGVAARLALDRARIFPADRRQRGDDRPHRDVLSRGERSRIWSAFRLVMVPRDCFASLAMTTKKERSDETIRNGVAQSDRRRPCSRQALRHQVAGNAGWVAVEPGGHLVALLQIKARSLDRERVQRNERAPAAPPL